MADGERVVVLHGLGRSPLSMSKISRALRAAGFAVRNVGYPSRSAPIEELAEHVRDQLPPGDGPLHFVTHSLGGIVVRQLIEADSPTGLRRVVMLAPPNEGSELASRFGPQWWFRWIMGPAGQQLGDLELEDAPGDGVEIGVVAGDRPLAFLSRWLTGAHDGIVRVEETELAAACDRIVLPTGHTWIMNDPAVIAQTLHFLETGSFRQDGDLRSK